MNRSAFQAALRAATRISFGTALFGCGASVTFLDSEEETDSDEAKYEEQDTPDSAYGYRPPSTEPACEMGSVLPDGQNWSIYDDAAFACCVDGLQAAIPADFEQSWLGQLPEATTLCCTQILAPNYEQIWQGQPLAHPAPDDVVDACCIAKHGNVACTPWGPPVPPAMAELDLTLLAQLDPILVDPIPWLSPRSSTSGAA